MSQKLHTSILNLESAYDDFNAATASRTNAVQKLPTFEKTMKNLRNSIKKE